MNIKKDYYAILGVIPSVEIIVIRAAYRALAQKYHPDRSDALHEDAVRRMQEINEAYAVLSDLAQRKLYDQARKNIQEGPAFSEEEGVRSAFEEATRGNKDHWQLANEYYPDLNQILSNLREVSYQLAFAFQSFLLETKDFEHRHEIATSMAKQFLETYFGTNPKIINFAKKLISLKAKDAAKELNRVIVVLGDQPSADRIIVTIKKKYGIGELHNEDRIMFARTLLANQGNQFNCARTLLEDFGGKIKYEVLQRSFGMSTKIRITINFRGKENSFNTEADFSEWIRVTLAREVMNS